MYEDSDANPTEQFWNHQAGLSGFGGSSYIDDVVLRDRDTTGNGTLDERRYYCQNQHHDVVLITDTSGSLIERANYNAYGEPIGTFSSIGNRKGYAGYELDPNLTELYHVRHRVLNSKLGRWTRRDPLGYVDATNLYLYAMARPIIMLDPYGRDTATMRCRGVQSDSSGEGGSYGILIQHCYVRCCRDDGICTDYSLLTGFPDAPGKACIVKGEEPGSAGQLEAQSKSSVAKTKTGEGLCDCLEAAFQANKGCNFDYSATNCNSNWFAGSMWECCTGSRGLGPIGAHFYLDRDCCRDDVNFKCPEGSPGHDRNYTCRRKKEMEI